MQNWLIADPEIIVLYMVFISFILTIAFGLFRFAKGLMYRLWSVSWIMFSVTSASSVLTTGQGLVPADAFATFGMTLASILLADGTYERRRVGIQLLVYVVFPSLAFLLVPLGIAFSWSYGVVFTPVGFLTTYACWSSLLMFKRKIVYRGIDYWTVLIGLFLWGVSMLLFPITIFLPLLDLQVIITTVGLIMVGTGMLNVFIATTTEDLKVQSALTQLMTGILNHDIRNYVGTLQEALEQIRTTDDKNFWIELSNEALESMSSFIQEMRRVSANLSRFEAEMTPLDVTELLNGVVTRVAREYNLSEDVFSIELPEQLIIMSNAIVKELFWNILDNAFKHGSESLSITVTGRSTTHLILEVHDDAGGLPDKILEFVNTPEALSSKAAPGMSLGVILIRGLSLLCGVRIKAENKPTKNGKVGTLYQLEFSRQATSS